MARPTRTVTVTDQHFLTPSMKRVHLGGESLRDFPEGFEGGYIKLLLGSEQKPTVRSYTIESFDASKPCLVIDMVTHGDAGPAARWANQVQAGDHIDIVGPGACQPINTQADWYLLAGDMSALPALRANLAKLPKDARGYLAVEVIAETDKCILEAPQGIEVHWIINPEPETPNSALEDTVMGLAWLPGEPSVWAAGEFSASRALRQYYRHERKIPRSQMYVSCYWKIGESDEGMKAAKKSDPEPW